jgi:hypothetical protein
MMDSEKLSAVLELAKRDEAGFCMQLASDFTVRTRALYARSGEEAIELYKAFNEIMHLTVNQALNAARGGKRYDLEEFINILVKTAEKRGLASAIQGAVDLILTKSP